ncbi:hypothetical protein O181_002833 [Austropuccinia psidii MF-1]|uniref:Reverse transcriptase Ty1/copia-type domain-containing protein n=1 Tax=Austropuccinia psidii MF-1 TaxID=1389203 RepID=A0A9Q3GCZ9_9BASI|nr:hypothetical protein [Austropuccinia psidii MF-1]
MAPKNVIPRTYKEAMNGTEKEEWVNAIEEELKNMRQMEVFEITEEKGDEHLINGGWIFAKRIDNMTGSIQYKARYVARGNKQWHNEEYKETFTLTGTFSALRFLLTWEAKCKWLVHSFDFTAAYLNAPIDMNVWIRPPDGLTIPKGTGCQLKKALYGTKQAGSCWWEHLSSKLKELLFRKSAYDASVYFNMKNGTVTWIHVEDGIVIAQEEEALNALKNGLNKSFTIKWKPGVTNMIGVEVKWESEGFTLTQKKLIDSVIAENWNGKKLNATPLPEKCDVSTTPPKGTIIEKKIFLSIIGSISYVANGTCPNISFAVNLLAWHAQAPTSHHWAMLQHFLGYLKNTRDQCLKLFPNDEDIIVASDASWGGEVLYSTHGHFLDKSHQVHGVKFGGKARFLAEKACQRLFNNDMRLLLQYNNKSTIRISNNTASNKWTRHFYKDFFLAQLTQNQNALCKTIPKLNNSNYLQFKVQTQAYLMKMDLVDCLTTNPETPLPDAAQQNELLKRRQKTAGIVIGTMGILIWQRFINLVNEGNPYNIWRTLLRHFTSNADNNQARIFSEFLALKHVDTLEKFISYIRQHIGKIASVRIMIGSPGDIKELLITEIIVSKLNNKYVNTGEILQNQRPLTISKVIDYLEQRRQYTVDSNESTIRNEALCNTQGNISKMKNKRIY